MEDTFRTHVRALTVAPAASRSNRNSYRLRINLTWLCDMGFVRGALVQMLPEPGGISFVLCDDNIKKYSELYADTKKKDGNLIQVSQSLDYPHLCLEGTNVRNAGLNPGDSMLIRYRYGLIRLRKLPVGVKVVFFAPCSARFSARWLADIGYVGGAVVTATATPGLIICRLEQDALNRTPQLVRYVRKNKMYLIQVREVKNCQAINLTNSCLKKAGFNSDDVLLATYIDDLLQLQKPDFVGLGF
jgi:hypothetical protein